MGSAFELSTCKGLQRAKFQEKNVMLKAILFVSKAILNVFQIGEVPKGTCEVRSEEIKKKVDFLFSSGILKCDGSIFFRTDILSFNFVIFMAS